MSRPAPFQLRGVQAWGSLVGTVERAFVEAVLVPEVRDRLVALGTDPVGHGAKAFGEVLEKDLALWQRVALASGVKVE